MARRSGAARVNPAYVFVAPALAAIGAFFFVPVAASVLLSFTDFDIYAVASRENLRMVGLANYTRLVQDGLFWVALRNTLYFVLVAAPLSLAASLGAALLLSAHVTRWKPAFRTALFLPVVTTLVAVAVVWRYASIRAPGCSTPCSRRSGSRPSIGSASRASRCRPSYS